MVGKMTKPEEPIEPIARIHFTHKLPKLSIMPELLARDLDELTMERLTSWK